MGNAVEKRSGTSTTTAAAADADADAENGTAHRSVRGLCCKRRTA
ncbi:MULTISPECIES: hypothetical protein [Streptomyces]|uniref:Uncharacterized protein n=1 Tax=Streptomyces virginiae TaxID=1961 RepID=A0ABQ3NYH8_STRVG|nr:MULTISPECIES: hypothetical protein [Streptomyces]MBP2348525.1 hypothetical protein [Streptomyces virginiae]GGQ08623.1 hypothetical protein GCM10010215_37340 [Streptomyces virginiae]GHI17833.1 hypothetical protein Scinn_72960 [Streptomyces virginiae]